jgi:hypothetical protein
VDSGKTLRSKPRDPAEMSGVCVCVCVWRGGRGVEGGRGKNQDDPRVGMGEPIRSAPCSPVPCPLCPSALPQFGPLLHSLRGLLPLGDGDRDGWRGHCCCPGALQPVHLAHSRSHS